MTDDRDFDAILRTGLRDLDVPAVSHAFDDQVLAGLRRTEPWWRQLWASAMPVLSSGACAFVVVAGVVFATTRMPAPGVAPAASTHLIAIKRDVQPIDLDRLVASPNLRAASLTIALSRTAPAIPPSDSNKGVVPDRPRGVGCRPRMPACVVLLA